MPPLVTIITPTTSSRDIFLPRLTEIVRSQDYPNLQWLICYDAATIGAKRNTLCEAAKGEIICCMDSDDLYATDYISKSVQHLISSKAQVTGLNSCYFYDTSGKLYDWPAPAPGSQPYVCEATMCFHKSAWEQNRFPDTSEGEGRDFLANIGYVSPHKYKDGFTAIIHGSNSECHKAVYLFKNVPVSDAPDVLRKYYP